LKPLHLNLASQPYRDERPFIAVASVMFVLTLVLAWYNVDTYLRYRTETQTTRSKIASLETQTAEERQQTESFNQRLRTVDVKLLAAQTQFANARLAERAFSWSELLDRLERVLPDYVRIESVSPNFGPDGTVHLAMQCVARDADGLVKTIDRLNRDPRFANPFPAHQDHTDQGYQFNLSVDYRPSMARPIQ
jgi:Tfp pilus assembly protein PilN